MSRWFPGMAAGARAFPLMMRRSFWVPALVVAGIACGAAALDGVYAGRAIPPRVSIDRLVVHKGERRMEAFHGEQLMKTYDVAVGRGGLGPKLFEGDGRTPEGTYRIDGRHPSRYRRFLHVSYPNAEDRRRYRRLQARGDVPRGRGIGSAIGVHGYPGSVDWIRRLFNWTDGCIAVDNDDIDELYARVEPNAVIEIRR